MVNGLGVLGWGVGGIEAEAAMLGQPVSMLIPRVVGFKLTGAIPSGATATDVVLTITEMLRKHGVVGKFVEFYGEGVSQVPLANRATIGNMSPEFGSTCAIFPIDEVTLDYLRLTGRSDESVALVEAYAKEQGMWLKAGPDQPEARYSEYLELDLSTVVPSIAGPKRPQDRIALDRRQGGLPQGPADLRRRTTRATPARRRVLPGQRPLAAGQHRRHQRWRQAGRRGRRQRPPVEEGLGHRPPTGATFEIDHGIVVDRLDHELHQHLEPLGDDGRGDARQERRREGPVASRPGSRRRWRPGSKVVTGYYEKAGMWPYLEKLGFHLVGYGCTTCIGNSGPLNEEISKAINDNDLAVTSVLSGNRNFEGRINPDVKMNYLASPPLVIAYALAGTMDFDFDDRAAGPGHRRQRRLPQGHLAGPGRRRARRSQPSISKEMFTDDYADVFAGDERWQSLPTPEGDTFAWDARVDLRAQAPVLRRHVDGARRRSPTSTGARVLAKLGDSVTTDHISPAGAIKADSPAGKYLADHGIERKDFNSYGSRRGNHEVMIRGTFANIRLKNLLLDGVEGGFTRDFTQPAASRRRSTTPRQTYQAAGIPLVILSGKEYGSGLARATGRPRARACSASRPSSPRATSASTAPTSSAWASSRCSTRPARTPTRSASTAPRPSRSPASRRSTRARRPRPSRSSPPRSRATDGRVRRRRAHRHPRRGRLLPQRRHPAVRPALARRLTSAHPDGRTPTRGAAVRRIPQNQWSAARRHGRRATTVSPSGVRRGAPRLPGGLP